MFYSYRFERTSDIDLNILPAIGGSSCQAYTSSNNSLTRESGSLEVEVKMDVPIFLLADYANRTADKKLNVLGIFNQINTRKFPARHRLLYLIIRVGAEYGEFDTLHDISVPFIDQDGNKLGEQKGKIEIRTPERPGRGYADIIMEIGDLILEKPGRYEFKVIINKDVKAIAPLDVVQLTTENDG